MLQRKLHWLYLLCVLLKGQCHEFFLPLVSPFFIFQFREEMREIFFFYSRWKREHSRSVRTRVRKKIFAIPLIFMVCAITRYPLWLLAITRYPLWLLAITRYPLWLLAINMKWKKGRVPLFGIRHWHRGIWLSGVHDTAVWISPRNRNHIFKKL